MNYIQKLKEENQALQAKLQSGFAAIDDFNMHLHSDKFNGQESDGGRRDWIATTDVKCALSNIRDAFHGIA